ncbi:MAG: ComF family protein [Rhizobium sp.]|nr:MAG: ComF family protein [Rhizobium sp.]
MKIMVDNFWPSCRCLYCGGPSVKMAICAACTVSLPWIEQACSGCARPQNFNGLCRRCLKKPMPFDAAWAAFQLDSPIREAIHTMKYRAGFAQAKLLGQLFAQKIGRRALPLPAVIIPVPLHQGRLRIRGYNQSRELALAIQRSLAIEVAPDLARRIRATPDQIGQSRSQRQKNLRGAFAVDARIKGQHVALLDDVMTTGATLAELATAARRAGAARIEAWAIARVP